MSSLGSQYENLLREVSTLRNLGRYPLYYKVGYPVTIARLKKIFPEPFEQHPEWDYPNMDSLERLEAALRNHLGNS